MHSGFSITAVVLTLSLLTGCSTAPQKSSGAVSTTTKALSPSESLQSSVRVRGLGKDCNDALRNGFMFAAHQKIGVVVSSSRAVVNDQLSLDEILDHSSGYVERYIIRSQHLTHDHCTIDMDVWIADSRIARRIIGRNRGNEQLDAQSITASYTTFKNNVTAADAMLQSVLRDFPQRSFLVNQSNYRVRFDKNRQVILEIPYSIAWNKNYLDSLREALHYTSLNAHKTGGAFNPQVDNKLSNDYRNNYSSHEYAGRIVIDSHDYFVGSIFYIPDATHFRTVGAALSQQRRPVLSVVYYDRNGTRMRDKEFCAEFQNGLSYIVTETQHAKRVELNTQKTMNYVFSVWLDEKTLSNLTRIELGVVAAADCSVTIKR